MTERTIKKFEKLRIGEQYVEGKTTTELQKEYHISYRALHEYLIIKGIKIRPARKRQSLRHEAPIGAKFGLWTVVSKEVKAGREVIEGSKDRTLYWRCQCVCGNLAWKNPTHLKNGTSTRCKKCGNKSYLTDEGFADSNAVIKYKYTQTINALPTRRHRGRRPPLTFNVSLEYLNNLFENQNHKCALSGMSIEPDLVTPVSKQNMSIDRIDSNIGYEEGNVQWVDKRINMMKGTLSNEEFIELCTMVAEHNKKE